MPIEIEAPDGTIIEFPDNTPDATITGVMAKHYPAPDAGRASTLPGEAPSLTTPASGATSITHPGQIPGAIWDLMRKYPQDTADLLGQGAGTGLGIATGMATGGPPGAIAGGAIGSATGKRVARHVGEWLGFPGSEQPGGAEAAVDAGLGTVGPVASVIGKTVRPVVGKVLGGGKGPMQEVSNTRLRAREAEKSFEQTKRDAYTSSKEIFPEDVLTSKTRALGEAANANKAFEDAVKKAQKSSEPLTGAQVNAISGAAWVLSDPVSALTILIGGHSARNIHKASAKKFLASEDAVRWALARPEGSTAKQTAASLTAFAGDKSLTADARRAALEIARAIDGTEDETRPPRETSRPKPLHDKRGRFVSSKDVELDLPGIIRGDR